MKYHYWDEVKDGMINQMQDIDDLEKEKETLCDDFGYYKEDWWNENKFGEPASCETFLDFENKLSKIICPLMVCSKCHKRPFIIHGGTGKVLSTGSKDGTVRCKTCPGSSRLHAGMNKLLPEVLKLIALRELIELSFINKKTLRGLLISLILSEF